VAFSNQRRLSTVSASDEVVVLFLFAVAVVFVSSICVFGCAELSVLFSTPELFSVVFCFVCTVSFPSNKNSANLLPSVQKKKS